MVSGMEIAAGIVPKRAVSRKENRELGGRSYRSRAEKQPPKPTDNQYTVRPMAATHQTPMGMPDLLPEDVYAHRRVEAIARDLLEKAGYLEIRTPLLEYVELFQRGVGEGTDIVEKEMYTFQGSEGKVLALRPE